MRKKIPQKTNAPDGGWGWFVVLGYSMNNMIVVPLMQVFTLLYQPVLQSVLNMTNLQINIIIAVNCSFGMLLGLFNGPILRFFGYRKTAIFGAFTIFLGNLLTSQAKSFWAFVIFYGFFVSCGMNLVMASFSLALNTYFVEKRGIATGIAMSITGLGPILMPLLVSFLMDSYGVHGSGLILSALTLHSVVAALLLQPIKWHKKKDQNDVINQNITTFNKMKGDKESKRNSVSKNELDEITPATKLMENCGTNEINDKPDMKLDPNEEEKILPVKSLDDVVKKHKITLWERIVRFFDFDLLCDPVYINISFGLSLAFIGEMNFSLMLPLVLENRRFETSDVAKLMSLLAFADICSRFSSPFISQSVKSKVRFVYLISLTSGIFFRICLIYSYSFFSLVVVTFGLGVTKGIRSVYTALVMPTYVPLHKLSSATGLQMVNNGLLYFLFGPLMGLLVDMGNYNIWIHAINCLTLCTIIMWFTELILIRKRKNKTKIPIVIRNEH